MSGEWMHAVLQMNRQQLGNQSTVLYGHISSYNKKTNAIKVLIPKLTDADGNMTESDWIQMSSPMVGDKWGFQWHPKSSATPDDLTKGESVIISIFQKSNGLWAATGSFYNDTMEPPCGGSDDGGTEDPDDPDGTNGLKPGEFTFHHESGSFCKFYENGDVQLYSANDLKVRAEQNLDVKVLQGDATITVDEGNLDVTVTTGDASVDVAGSASVTAGLDVTVTADGDVNVAAASATVEADTVTVTSAAISLGTGTQQELLNIAFLELFNTHTHADPQGGTTTGPLELATQGVHSTINTTAS